MQALESLLDAKSLLSPPKYTMPWPIGGVTADKQSVIVVLFESQGCQGFSQSRSSRKRCGVRAAGVHSTFDLSRALSIHGQKHIWDNISGDALAALSHYKAHKVVWLLKPRPDQTRPDLLDYSLVLFFGSLVLGVGTFRRLRKA